MRYSRLILVIAIFSQLILLLGMSSRPKPKERAQAQELIIRSVIEQTLADIESYYSFNKQEELMGVIDERFNARDRFFLVLKSYLQAVGNPHLHFVIDMVVNDKENINVRLHWFRGGLTGSGVMISVQGNSSLLFRKYADRIKIIRISGDNPFY